MDHSKSYAALDQMIEDGQLMTGISESNFNHALVKLELYGLISSEEHETLLQRFATRKIQGRQYRNELSPRLRPRE